MIYVVDSSPLRPTYTITVTTGAIVTSATVVRYRVESPIVVNAPLVLPDEPPPARARPPKPQRIGRVEAPPSAPPPLKARRWLALVRARA